MDDLKKALDMLKLKDQFIIENLGNEPNCARYKISDRRSNLFAFYRGPGKFEYNIENNEDACGGLEIDVERLSALKTYCENIEYFSEPESGNFHRVSDLLCQANDFVVRQITSNYGDSYQIEDTKSKLVAFYEPPTFAYGYDNNYVGVTYIDIDRMKALVDFCKNLENFTRQEEI